MKKKTRKSPTPKFRENNYGEAKKKLVRRGRGKEGTQANEIAPQSGKNSPVGEQKKNKKRVVRDQGVGQTVKQMLDVKPPGGRLTGVF